MSTSASSSCSSNNTTTSCSLSSLASTHSKHPLSFAGGRRPFSAAAAASSPPKESELESTHGQVPFRPTNADCTVASFFDVDAKDPDAPILLDTTLYPVLPGSRMKALKKTAPKKGLEYVDTEKPIAGPNDILIAVRKTAICGTDLHIWDWDDWSRRTVPTPMVTGHEFSGYIKEMGSQVEAAGFFKIGDRVTGEGHITCGHCRNCRAGRRHLCRNTLGLGVNRPGCFAEYVSLPASNVFKLSDQIQDDVASFMDPLGNAVHSALSFDLIGEDVLIAGAGPIGCMAAAVCKHVGARHVVVTDINDFRLDLARQCGATSGVNVGKDGISAIKREMQRLDMKEGFDVALEMSGQPSALQAILSTMNNGGRISLLGIPSRSAEIDWNTIVFKGIVLKGIYGREMFETWYKMNNMLCNGLQEDIMPVLTNVHEADDFERAFANCANADSGKVLLNWD